MYLFNAEPFPLPELQDTRLLKASALPQKKNLPWSDTENPVSFGYHVPFTFPELYIWKSSRAEITHP